MYGTKKLLGGLSLGAQTGVSASKSLWKHHSHDMCSKRLTLVIKEYVLVSSLRL